MGIEKRLIKQGDLTVVYTMSHPLMGKEHGDVSDTATTTVDMFDRAGAHICSKEYRDDHYNVQSWRRLSRIWAQNAFEIIRESL